MNPPEPVQHQDQSQPHAEGSVPEPITAAPAAYTTLLGTKELRSLRQSGTSAVAVGVFVLVMCLLAFGVAATQRPDTIHAVSIAFTAISVAFGIALIGFGVQTKRFASTVPARAIRALNGALISSVVYIALSLFLHGIIIVTLLVIVLVITQFITRARVKA